MTWRVAFYLGILILTSSGTVSFADSRSTSAESRLSTNESNSHPSNKFAPKSIGHLVTPNTNVLQRGQVGIGTLYAAYGVTDELSVGVSPFAYYAFEMHNIMARWAKPLGPKTRVGFDAAYFKSFNDGPDSQRYSRGGYYDFKMEAWVAKGTWNRLMLPYYRLNLSGSLFYYLNDVRPFSLRMDPQNSDRYAANLTSLHEIRLSQNVYWNVEAGFWGLNYTYPYYHLGTSLNLQNEGGLLGLGISTTFSPSFPAEKAKQFAGYDSTASYHPEIQFQLFF
ncbi:MAG: hypothetical protein AB7F86_16045 [Bdellovibrionales bacterium]